MVARPEHRSGKAYCVFEESVRLKRLVSNFLVAGLLASGAMFVAASPSAAARDNTCMDQAHWSQISQTYGDAWGEAVTTLSNWENAYYYVSDSGQQVWVADVAGIYTISVGYSDYLNRLSDASHDVETSWALFSTFVDTVVAC